MVIIIDRTGSMIAGSNNVGGHTRLYWANKTALQLVNGVAGEPGNPSLGDNHVEVITFGDGTSTLVQGLTNDAVDLRNDIDGISDPSAHGHVHRTGAVPGDG